MPKAEKEIEKKNLPFTTNSKENRKKIISFLHGTEQKCYDNLCWA